MEDEEEEEEEDGGGGGGRRGGVLKQAGLDLKQQYQAAAADDAPDNSNGLSCDWIAEPCDRGTIRFGFCRAGYGRSGASSCQGPWYAPGQCSRSNRGAGTGS